MKKRSAARGHPPEPVWHTGMAAAVVEGDGEPQTHTSSSRRRRSWCGRAAMGVVVEEKVSVGGDAPGGTAYKARERRGERRI